MTDYELRVASNLLSSLLGDNESEDFWLETLRWLKTHGLKDVAYVVSDGYNGLVNAARRSFQGSI
jgi:transposase-like protein